LELSLGRVTSVISATANSERALDIHFDHESGAVSSARIDMYVPLEFTNETISLSSTTQSRSWRSESVMDFVLAFQAMIDDLVDAISGRAPKNSVVSRLSDVAEGSRMVHILEAGMARIADVR
jgi:hypothetical protein